jgi:pescadillo
MLHDPLIQAFRDYRVWRRKLKKAQGKHDKLREEQLLKEKPEFTYNHLVKERYPTFVDALRDSDDALTLIHLFAIMPVSVTRLKPEHVELCQRLAHEFQYYVIRNNALRKVFVSIKGYYLQAEIFGQTVTWIMPHRFNQRPASDVDYKIMLTFLEYYEVLMGFINFKLFHSLGLKYPPKLDEEKDSNADVFRAIIAESITNAAAAAATAATGSGTGAADAESQKKKLDQLKKRSEQRLAKLNEAVAKFAAARDDAAAAAEEKGQDSEEDVDVFDEETEKIRAEQDVYGKLFEGCLFYISREVRPIGSKYQFILQCRRCGGARNA